MGNRLNSAGRLTFALSLGVALMAGPWAALGQSTGEAVSRHVNIWSEGTRMSGDLWAPADAQPGAKLPAILLTHGWGGVRSHLNSTYAPKFAAAGFIVLAFDYRGWADSDSRLVIAGEQPTPDASGEVTVRARAIREVVDPYDQVADISAALDFLVGEPQVDTSRIGIWGTSYSGGHALFVGARDPRIRAIVSQVGYQDSREAVRLRFAQQGGEDFARKRATQKARGEIAPIPQGIDQFSGLRGTPDIAKMVHYRPIAVAHRVRAPTLFIDQDAEELFDRRNHGLAAYEIVRQHAPARYELLPGKHYAVYRDNFERASDLALAWFREHLGGE